MTAIARKVLRRKFYQADIGVSGVNFAVAETGTFALVENEGNGRFCTTLPPVHIALMGIEKVVEHLEDVPPLLSLLTRSATGQAITTYFNMITSPRKDGEKDGPKNVYLILLDNGRSQIYSDQLLRETLLVHTLRSVHESLSSLYKNRRTCLQHNLSRSNWENSNSTNERT